jgi:hypothetical protein
MSLTRITVRIKMAMRRRNDAAADRPMSSEVKAFFQIEYEIVSVELPGPPRVRI